MVDERLVIIETQIQTVLPQRHVHTQREPGHRLPFQLVVTDVGQCQTRSLIQESLGSKISTGGKTVDIIVTRLIHTDIHFQIVYTLYVPEERLGRNHPSSLQRGEYAPYIISQFHTPVGIFTETSGGLARHRTLQEIFVSIIPTGIHIHGRRLPFLENAIHQTVNHILRYIRQLVTHGIIRPHGIRIKRIAHVTETAEQIDYMATITTRPINPRVARHRQLLAGISFGLVRRQFIRPVGKRRYPFVWNERTFRHIIQYVTHPL